MGKPILENDIWIASIAYQNNLTLGIKYKHFKNFDSIQVIEWKLIEFIFSF